MSDAYGLGRLHAPDARDRRFSISSVVFPHEALPPRPRQRPYNLGATLNQGSTSRCVGYSCRDKIASAPLMYHADQGPSPDEIYVGAQDNDEWEGHDYEGTSVRGAFKYLQQRGYIESYVWATTLASVERFVRDGYGTCVAGTIWKEAMFQPDAKGFVRPEGAIVGGHAYHLFWMVPETREIWFKNSWGANWGITLHARPGCFKMTYEHFEQLMADYGEVGAALEIKVR